MKLKIKPQTRWRNWENALRAIDWYLDKQIDFSRKHYRCPLCGGLKIEKLNGKHYCHSCLSEF
jgi:hypothetical protein